MYALAWAVWIPLAIARRRPAGQQVNLSLTLFAGAAPGLAATLVAWVALGRRGAARLWERLGKWRIAWPWYLAALLVPALIPILTAGVLSLQQGLPPAFWTALQPISLLFGLLTYIPMAVFEEIGWRGLAQPGLQARRSALVSSAIVGLAWSLWHLPYFLIPDFRFFPAGWQGFATGLALYALGTIPTCILMAWLFNNSSGSLILPCVFHGATNVFSGAFLIPLVKAGGLLPLAISTGWTVLASLIVLAVFGYRRLVRGSVAPDDAAFRL